MEASCINGEAGEAWLNNAFSYNSYNYYSYNYWKKVRRMSAGLLLDVRHRVQC